MHKTALDGFIDRFQAILDALDAMCDDDELEELNAQLEDCILLLWDADPEDADGQEEIQDALEEIAGLPDEYRDIGGASNAILESANALEMAARMAQANL